MAPPSLSRDCRDLIEEAVEVEGVETERSSGGTASSAREGETEGEGEEGRCRGEATLLRRGLEILLSAIVHELRVQQSGFTAVAGNARFEVRLLSLSDVSEQDCCEELNDAEGSWVNPPSCSHRIDKVKVVCPQGRHGRWF